MRNERVALITGGTSGIGLASAIRFATEGYAVAICGRTLARVNAAAKAVEERYSQARITTIVSDLSEPEAPENIYREFFRNHQHLDVLVNAAGVAFNCSFDKTTAEIFQKTWNVNVQAVYFLTQKFWGKFQQQQGGTVVNVSSLAAVSPFDGFSAYGSSKAWLDLFTVAIAREGRPWGIRAFSIRPGAVETPMLRGLFPEFPHDQTVTADDVAAVIWEVTKDEFRHSSGQAIAVTRQ